MNLLPLKIYCTCHAHVWALDLMPLTGDDGPYWRLESHDRPDGTPCPETTRSNKCRVATAEEIAALPAAFRERVEADARALAVQLGLVADDGEPRP